MRSRADKLTQRTLCRAGTKKRPILILGKKKGTPTTSARHGNTPLLAANLTMVYICKNHFFSRGETFNEASYRLALIAGSQSALSIDPKRDWVPRPCPGQETEEAADDRVCEAGFFFLLDGSSTRYLPDMRFEKPHTQNNTGPYDVGPRGTSAEFSAMALAAARRSGRFLLFFSLASLIALSLHFLANAAFFSSDRWSLVARC